MPREEAEYHMKRCVDSGLWVPEANKDNNPVQETQTSASEESVEKETYEEVDWWCARVVFEALHNIDIVDDNSFSF